MRKGIVVALAGLAMGFGGLFAAPAKGLQGGFSVGYNSVGFQLHGMGGEILLGFQGKDEHRPQGSVLRIGLAGAAGTGEADLTEATWDGQSYNDFIPVAGDRAVSSARAGTISALRITEAFNDLGPQQQGQVDGAIAASLYPNGAAAFNQLPAAQQQAIAVATIQSIKDSALEEGLAAYGVTDSKKAKGRGSAFLFSVAYEYVLARGAPGLGFIVGGELYVSQGGYASLDPSLPNASTDGGIGGGGVVGVSYYLKNGLNFAFKTGLGVIDPGEVTLFGVKVEPESLFYASPSFALGFIY